MPQSSATITAIALALVSFIPLGLALYMRHRLKRLRTTGTETPGTVEDIFKLRASKGGTYYKALINFQAHGAAQRLYYTFSKTKLTHILAKDARVTVVYNPSKPKRFLIKEIPESNTLIIVTTIMSIVYLIIAFYLYDYIRQ